MKKTSYLSLPALAFQQGKQHTLFTFAVEGAKLKEFAAVARLNRQEDDRIDGYQRPEVLAHIANITKYLASEGPMLPNAIVVAFDDVVKFIPNSDGESGSVKSGTLCIPISDSSKHRKAAWIVDGQQRASALEQAAIADFMVCVVGFVAGSDEEQREQFMLVNSTKPLPRSLIYELLPQTHCSLPGILEKRKLPALLLTALNLDKDSPFYRKIRTATNPDGIIQDNSALRMIENSLADGVLYVIHQSCKEHVKAIEKMLAVLCEYWRAVEVVFPSAWELSPNKSRLTHGAGIISMGFIMDAIVNRNGDKTDISDSVFVNDLEKLAPVCRWTHGFWEFGPGDQRKWNEIQNTPTDIRILSSYLLLQYKRLIWSDALRFA